MLLTVEWLAELAGGSRRGYTPDRKESDLGIVCIASAIPGLIQPTDRWSVSRPVVSRTSVENLVAWSRGSCRIVAEDLGIDPLTCAPVDHHLHH